MCGICKEPQLHIPEMLKHIVQIMTYSNHAGVVKRPHLKIHHNPPDNVTDMHYIQQGMRPSHMAS